MTTELNTMQWTPNKGNGERSGGWRTKNRPDVFIGAYGEGDGKPLRYTFYHVVLYPISTHDTLDEAKHAAETYRAQPWPVPPVPLPRLKVGPID